MLSMGGLRAWKESGRWRSGWGWDEDERGKNAEGEGEEVDVEKEGKDEREGEEEEVSSAAASPVLFGAGPRYGEVSMLITMGCFCSRNSRWQ